MGRIKQPISLALLFAAFTLTACGGWGDTPQVAFPDSMSGRALHCAVILGLRDLDFRRTYFGDISLSWIEDEIVYGYDDYYAPAHAAAVIAALEFDAGRHLLDEEAIKEVARSVVALFEGTDGEFGRHSDLCVEVFGPRD